MKTPFFVQRFPLSATTLYIGFLGLMLMLTACEHFNKQKNPREVAIYDALRLFYVNGLEKNNLSIAYFATKEASYVSRKNFDEQKWKSGEKSSAKLYERIQKKIKENGGISKMEILHILPGTGEKRAPSEHDRVTYKVTYKNGKSFVDKERKFIRVAFERNGDRFDTAKTVNGKLKSMVYPEGDAYRMDSFSTFMEGDSNFGAPIEP